MNAAGPDIALPLGRMLVALAVVLVMLGGLAWLMRRGVLRRRGAGALGIESALTLGDRRSLIILSVEGRRLLLGLAPGNVSLLTELARSAPGMPAGSGSGASFGDALARAAAPGSHTS